MKAFTTNERKKEMKPQIKYEGGKIFAQGIAALDSDKDGKAAVTIAVEVQIDAMEAVSEIIKNEVPEWLKTLLAGKV